MLWLKPLNEAGYGQIRLNDQLYYAHRVSYVIAYGPIPDGLEVDHVKAKGCTNRHCVAPLHLEAVTRVENMRRTTRTHCHRGHAFDEANTYIRSDTGIQQCKACGYLRKRLAAAARRSA